MRDEALLIATIAPRCSLGLGIFSFPDATNFMLGPRPELFLFELSYSRLISASSRVERVAVRDLYEKKKDFGV